MSLFPCCAGRYVTRLVAVEPSCGLTLKQQRACILCSNAGISFSHSVYPGPRPSVPFVASVAPCCEVLGPITGLFERALGTVAKADGCGGPLMRVGASSESWKSVAFR